MFEERSGHSPDLPSTGTSGGSAHPGCLFDLLSHGDAEAQAHAACSRADTPSGVGETGRDSDAGCVVPHHRWPPVDHAALHRAEPRAGASPPSIEARPTAATASAHHHCRLVRFFPPTQNVVETFEVSLLKTKGIPPSPRPNCEGWVSVPRGNRRFSGKLPHSRQVRKTG